MPMTRKEKIELLRRVKLFSGVGAKQLGEIVDLMTEIAFPPGRYIVRRGQVGTGFYLITQGAARVQRGDRTVSTLGPGDFFGEMSVLDQSPRIAHVVTDEPTTVLALASWDFNRLLERNAKLTLAILKEVAARLRAASEEPAH